MSILFCEYIKQFLCVMFSFRLLDAKFITNTLEIHVFRIKLTICAAWSCASFQYILLGCVPASPEDIAAPSAQHQEVLS